LNENLEQIKKDSKQYEDTYIITEELKKYKIKTEEFINKNFNKTIIDSSKFYSTIETFIKNEIKIISKKKKILLLLL
jgi:Ribonuclease G/E